MAAILHLSFVDARRELIDESIHEEIDLEVDDVLARGDRLFVVDRIDIFCVDEKGRENPSARFDAEGNTLVAFVVCVSIDMDMEESLGIDTTST